MKHGHAAGVVRIRTGRGLKHLRLLKRSDLKFEFEMNMGRPEITAERFSPPLSTGARDVTILWVGNPQCAVPVDDFDFDWRAMGAEIERHPNFRIAPTFRSYSRWTSILSMCGFSSAARARR